MQSEFMLRPRINTLLAQAVKKPLTIVCAGMGCGKTRAVYDFTQECKIPVAWIQIIKADNIGPRLWELFVRAVAKTNKKLANEYEKLGFPDTEDKLSLYINIQNSMTNGMPCVFVFDDFHLLKDVSVLKFIERGINNLPKNVSVFLISRDFPKINISKLLMQDKVYIVNDSELNFTENEISQLLSEQGLDAEICNLKKIYSDTNGWAFSVGFAVRMLKKSPGYMGYVSDAIKYDILQLVEMEIWDLISERLRHFLLRFSLVKHHSSGMMIILSGGDESLIAELKTQNAFIRFNNHMASWHIHPALLTFLSTKQNLLSDEEIHDTYKASADWCIENNFIVDALSYYEKIGDYEKIVSILFERQAKFLADNAQQLFNIFERAPKVIFDQVDFSAALHIQVAYHVGGWNKASELSDYYEAKYQQLPEANDFRNKMLGCVYFYRGYLRMLMSTYDDRYDFDIYFAKLFEYLKEFSIDPKCWYQHPTGMWTSMVGVSRAGAPQEYADSLGRSSQYLQKCVNGLTAGIDDLCRGELLFYQGNINEAKIYVRKSLDKAMEHKQLIIIHRTMFCLMRIAVFQGDYSTAEQILRKMEEQLTINDCLICIINSEISIAWFYIMLSYPERVLSWLKEKFTPYTHANSLENFGNQIKARFYYQTNNYAPLLTFIEEKKRRETILFERVEVLALEACIYYKMNDYAAALKALQEAYETAAPNTIVMPFIELGRDMRVLVTAAAGDPNCTIPQVWLVNIKHMASAYSRNLELITSEYKKKNEMVSKITLSPRELVILQDMYAGLSNPEIAARLNLSINTVKMHIGSIYNKFGSRNKADVFRIAAENNLFTES